MIERVVCGNCAIPMKCTKTGKQVCYNDSVIMTGDEFTCPQCGASIIPISGNAIPAFAVKDHDKLLQVNE